MIRGRAVRVKELPGLVVRRSFVATHCFALRILRMVRALAVKLLPSTNR